MSFNFICLQFIIYIIVWNLEKIHLRCSIVNCVAELTIWILNMTLPRLRLQINKYNIINWRKIVRHTSRLNSTKWILFKVLKLLTLEVLEVEPSISCARYFASFAFSKPKWYSVAKIYNQICKCYKYMLTMSSKTMQNIHKNM